MASITRAIGNWFRAKRDAAAEVLGDPTRDSKFAIEDSKKKVAEFTVKLAKLAAETNRLQRERDKTAEDIAKWQRIAEKAAAENEVDDAREALKKKADATQRESTLADETTRNEEVTEKMREQLNAARAKIARAESNRVRLVARLEGAKVPSGAGQGPYRIQLGRQPAGRPRRSRTDRRRCRERSRGLGGTSPARTRSRSTSRRNTRTPPPTPQIEAELAALMEAKSPK